jgi:hypothetical protein
VTRIQVQRPWNVSSMPRKGELFVFCMVSKLVFGAHPVSCIMDMGVKRQGHEADNWPPSSAVPKNDWRKSPLPQTSSWSDDQWNMHKDNFIFSISTLQECFCSVCLFYLFRKIKVALWDRLAVCVSVCISTIATFENLNQYLWNLVSMSWHLIPSQCHNHKSLSSVIPTLQPLRFLRLNLNIS